MSYTFLIGKILYFRGYTTSWGLDIIIIFTYVCCMMCTIDTFILSNFYFVPFPKINYIAECRWMQKIKPKFSKKDEKTTFIKHFCRGWLYPVILFPLDMGAPLERQGDNVFFMYPNNYWVRENLIWCIQTTTTSHH